MALLLTLSMGLQAAGQKHRHTPRSEQVDTTDNGGVVVFSDTTSSDTVTVTKHNAKFTVTTRTSPWSSNTATYELDDDDFGSLIRHAFGSMDSNDFLGMFFVLCVLLIIFVLAPVLIIIALFYFINKNRKEKMRLAQMAMQQGQPILGLMVFLGYAAGQVGFGIGALVFCIGLGKVFASKTSRKNDHGDFYNDNMDNKDKF